MKLFGLNMQDVYILVNINLYYLEYFVSDRFLFVQQISRKFDELNYILHLIIF